MKLIRLSIVTLLSVFLFVSVGDAIDVSQWSLPENAVARIGKGQITDMTYSPDGKLLAVGTPIGAWLYDAQTGDEVALLTGHTKTDLSKYLNLKKRVLNQSPSIAFSPDGKTIAIAGWDQKVRLWDVQTRKYKTTLIGGNAHTVRYSPDGNIICGLSYRITTFWDAKTHKQIKTLELEKSGFATFAFSPDGKTLVSSDRDNNIHLWDVLTGLQKSRLKGHRQEVKAFSFSPDGTVLASGDWADTIELWNLKTEKRKKTIEGFHVQLNSLAFSPNGKTLASAGFDPTVYLWDPKTGRQQTTLKGHKGAIFTLAFSPDGQTLASGSYDGTIIFWDTRTGKQKRTITHTQHNLPMTIVDGKTLVSQHNGDIQLWNIYTRRIEKRLILDPKYTSIFLMSRDGTTLVSCTYTRQLREMKAWNVQTGKHQATLTDALSNFHSSAVNSRTLSSDGKTLALGKTNSTVELWDTQTGKIKWTFRKHQGWVYSVAFSPDGRYLVSGEGYPNAIHLWDVINGKHAAVLAEKSGPTSTLVFSQDGSMLAGGDSSGVWMWDMKTRKRIHVFKDGPVSVLAFSGDGTKLAGADSFGIIEVWDIPTGRLQDTFFGHSGSVTSLAFLSPESPNALSKNEHILASTGEDGTILLWEIKPVVNTDEVVKIAPHVVESPAIGEKVKFNINVAGAENVTGFQVTVDYDTTALRYLSSEKGDYLTDDADFEIKDVYPNRLKLISKSSDAVSKEDGTLADITFEVIEAKSSIIDLPRVRLEKGDNTLALPITARCSVVEPKTPDGEPVDYTKFSLPEGVIARIGKGTVNDIKMSPDKTLLAVVGSVGVWLYDAKTGGETALLTGHTKPVSTVAFSPQGDLLASGSYDGKLRIWNPYTRQLLRELNVDGNIAAIVFSPDGRTLVNTIGNRMQFWSTHLWQQKQRRYTASSSIIDLAFSPDGETIASASMSDEIHLWDARTGDNIFTFDDERGWMTSVNFAPGGPRLAFSPDGKTLASTARDFSRGKNKKITLWNVHTGELSATFAEENQGLSNPVSTVQFSPDGNTLISADRNGTLREWNVQTGENIILFGNGEKEDFSVPPFIVDRTTLTRITKDGTIHIWNTETGKDLSVLTGYGNAINSAVLSTDESTLITAHVMQGLQIWDMKTRHLKATIAGDFRYTTLTLMKDNRTLAYPWAEDIRLVDIHTQQEIATLSGHKEANGYNNTKKTVFSPNSQILASNEDNLIRFWDIRSGEQTKTIQGHTDRINSIAFSPDGTMLVSGSGYRSGDGGDNTIRIWNTVTGKQLARYNNFVREHHENPFPFTAVAFSPDGKTIAGIDRSADVQLWDVGRKKHISLLIGNLGSPDSHYYDHFTVSYSPDNRTLVSTGYNSTINVWDVETEKLQNTLKGHTGSVTSLSFTADGTTLVSGSEDGTVLLWKMSPSPTTRLNITPHFVESPPFGEHLAFNINLDSGQDVSDYQFTLKYDTSALRYIPNREIDQSKIVAGEDSITISGNASAVDRHVATITFEVLEIVDSTITLTDDSDERTLSVPVYAWVVKPPPIFGDVNEDWQLNTADLEYISARLGQTGKNLSADVNEDGVVDLADLVFVTNALNGTNPKPSTD